MTLLEFLEARIAEDEAVRRAVIGHRGAADGLDIEVQRFNAWFGPARLRVECEAKRRIVAAFEYREARADESPITAAHATGLLLAIRNLAAVYLDHPDYLPEWKP